MISLFMPRHHPFDEAENIQARHMQPRLGDFMHSLDARGGLNPPRHLAVQSARRHLMVVRVKRCRLQRCKTVWPENFKIFASLINLFLGLGGAVLFCKRVKNASVSGLTLSALMLRVMFAGVCKCEFPLMSDRDCPPLSP